MHIEKERKSAAELGIVMPTPSVRPFFAALGILTLLGGLPFYYAQKKGIAFTLIGVGAIVLVSSLYDWLTTPLEPEH
jgi:hypothetical protein